MLRTELNALMLDVDNMLLQSNNDKCSHQHHLSPYLTKFDSKSFIGFWIVTHRCYLTIKQTFEIHAKVLIRKKRFENFADIFLTNVISNYEKLTGLPCLGVSTPDDEAVGFGKGYERFIRPHEMKVLEGKKSKGYYDVSISSEFKDEQPVKKFDTDTKKGQIQSIINNASEYIKSYYTDAKLNIHYYDDVEKLCLSTLEINPYEFPSNINTLSIYQHDPSPELATPLLIGSLSHPSKTLSTTAILTTKMLPQPLLEDKSSEETDAREKESKVYNVIASCVVKNILNDSTDENKESVQKKIATFLQNNHMKDVTVATTLVKPYLKIRKPRCSIFMCRRSNLDFDDEELVAQVSAKKST